MAGKGKKSTAITFNENDPVIMEAASEVLGNLDALSNEARYMMDENPESKGNIALWNCLVDIEEMVTILSEGNILSSEESIALGNACVEAAQYFNRSEDISRAEVIAIFKKLNGLVFKNDELNR